MASNQMTTVQKVRVFNFLENKASDLNGLGVTEIIGKVKKATKIDVTAYTLRKLIQEGKLPIDIRKHNNPLTENIAKVNRLDAEIEMLCKAIGVDRKSLLENVDNAG